MRFRFSRTWIAACLIGLIVAGLAMVLPSGVFHNLSHKTDPDAQDFGRFRQLAFLICAYQSDNGKFPETLKEMETEDYLNKSSLLKDIARRAQYFKPSDKADPRACPMLLLPVKDGSFVAYSNGVTLFTRESFNAIPQPKEASLQEK